MRQPPEHSFWSLFICILFCGTIAADRTREVAGGHLKLFGLDQQKVIQIMETQNAHEVDGYAGVYGFIFPDSLCV
ncbi:hypothetical protein D5086_031061 [Populus alba]|uniref:Uncharacterized protein n=1 Tax=Populus alba TaxID=43335 RepID=A0ACC4AQF0_POPAL